MIKRSLYILIACLLMVSCTQQVQNPKKIGACPDIFPDYVGVTIPVGIAPMDFNTLTPGASIMDVVVRGSKGGEIHVQGEYADFDVDEWHELTAQNKGGEGFPEYDYLYLQEDKGGQWQGLLVDEINKFFKE